MSIMVKNPDATETEWVFTLGSATALAGKQVGKTGPNALHVGDTITVKCIPAKDGHPLGFLKSITYADGHVIVVSGGNPND
jgi:regulator of RNase E activity RraA